MSSYTIKNPASGHTSEKADHNTREQLLDAATALFAERGIATTTVAQIAARVGVTSAMIHYYFKTRDHLLDAIIEERIIRSNVFVWHSITESEDDPLTLVRSLVSRIIQVCDEMPWLPPLWIREIVSDGGLMREKILRRIPTGKHKKFGKCITLGQKQGVVNPDIDPRLLFMSIIGLTMLPLATVKIWNRVPTLAGLKKDALARHVIALLMHGLANPSLGDKTNSG
ncbi:MAG: TetR/AcrR family transcriptional regulator [Smithella sp.]|jgi:AcrR family transcriptional regulator